MQVHKTTDDTMFHKVQDWIDLRSNVSFSEQAFEDLIPLNFCKANINATKYALRASHKANEYKAKVDAGEYAWDSVFAR